MLLVFGIGLFFVCSMVFKEKIFIVDDDLVVCSVFNNVLIWVGYNVSECEDGFVVLEWV